MGTEAEVAKHSTEADCWVIMGDLVYNLGKDFLDEHPGGPDVITALAGKDATTDFEDIAHSDSARTWANKYIIGYREGASDDAKTKETPTNGAVSASGSKGGGMGGILPAVAVVLAGLVGYMVSRSELM